MNEVVASDGALPSPTPPTRSDHLLLNLAGSKRCQTVEQAQGSETGNYLHNKQ